MGSRILKAAATAAILLLPVPSSQGATDTRADDDPGTDTSERAPGGMVLIPAGTAFIGIDEDELDQLVEMGSDVPHMDGLHALQWFGDETPRHEVAIAPFYLDIREVTNGMFQAFVETTGYEAEGDWRAYAGEGREAHPVVNVTWHDANAYAQWAGKRLPTEAEWEYAARGGSSFRWFPWGDRPDPALANWRHEGESFLDGLGRLVFGRKIRTTPAGVFPPNGFGLHDMVGNAAEWCADTYGVYPGFALEERLGEEQGPDGENETPRRVVRGGSWDAPNPVFVRITARNAFPETHASSRIGFRCARDAR